jgi:nitric oxide reductase subunit C
VLAAWDKRSDAAGQGEVRFKEMFCTTCHSLQVTRGDETKLIGGDIGPELTKVGSKVNPDWLVAWLRNPQGYLAHATMPRYGWTDEDLYKVTQYLTTKLTDPDLLANVPELPDPSAEDVALGQRLFADKGCASCHLVQGVNPQRDFGPDLSVLGGKNVSQLEFGNSKIPRTLLAYIEAKVNDPLSVNSSARMPQYHLKPADLDAITTALLGMRGNGSRSGMERLVVPKREGQFNPAGTFGELYERYKCDVCHAFNGHGGTLAPDLSFEGSRANRQWIIDFLKNPQTLRPTLLFRMPQFNIPDQEAVVIADYLVTACQSREVMPPGSDQPVGGPELAAAGKELYEVKYACQACHTIGSSGGYVGPNLSNAGNWLTAQWITQWLRNPQSLVPGAIEPRRNFTDQEIEALTAYLVTLKPSGPAQPKAGGASAAGGMR